MIDNLLEVEGLKKTFPIKKGILKRKVGEIRALNNVSLYLKQGETLGIVGESGCGKSTLAKLIMRIIEPTEGRILFENQDIAKLKRGQLRNIRSEFQMVFQDPYESLNPKMKIEKIISEPLYVNTKLSKTEIKDRTEEIIEQVGLKKDDLSRYPHQFSGGQRQRIGIARAIILNPKLLVADEAVSALDVSVQSQILNLLMELKNEYNLSYIFISHDLTVIKNISDRIAVMYLGDIVESSNSNSIYKDPLHPYTQALITSIPKITRKKEKKTFIKGEIPDPSNPPSGCPFHTRCPKKMDICSETVPLFKEVKDNHYVACHLY